MSAHSGSGSVPAVHPVVAVLSVVRVGVRDLESRLGLDRATIWRWYRAGKFPAPHYLADKRVWFLSEIEAWEAAQMARPASDRRGAKNTEASAAT